MLAIYPHGSIENVRVLAFQYLKGKGQQISYELVPPAMYVEKYQISNAQHDSYNNRYLVN